MSEKTYRVLAGEARGGTIRRLDVGRYGVATYLHDVERHGSQFVIVLPIEEVPLYV